MHFTKVFTAIALIAAPALSAPVSPREATVPQASLQDAQTAIKAYIQKADGRHNQFNNYGDAIQKIVPLSRTADQLLGADTVLAIDILFDQLCIAGANQGSICNEVLGYAYALTIAQERSMTFQAIANVIGQDNVAQANANLRTLCLGPDNGIQANIGLCQGTIEDVDVLANSLIGTSDLSEDAKNKNTFDDLGLSCLYHTECQPTLIP